ncbi:hypothetical protein FDP41_001011 [Naegleria fowleri]|uniref:Zeta toxin domain-containing protein n=1 Tax=Naegleria fowleri TaxID=5763 RepID=A0A6A5C1T3_NAEFO|nr:uncharacterized protein FDP41_001011 [Naegleria fowleri]KAF0979858.1 hypothetical protein FDP41_001011 [Naegleria fowleri]
MSEPKEQIDLVVSSSSATTNQQPQNSNNPKDKVVFIYVLDTEQNDDEKQQPTELPQSQEYQRISCYAHYHVLSTLLIMGCKQSDAAEISDLVFKWLSEAKTNLLLQKHKQQLSERSKHSSEDDEYLEEINNHVDTNNYSSDVNIYSTSDRDESTATFSHQHSNNHSSNHTSTPRESASSFASSVAKNSTVALDVVVDNSSSSSEGDTSESEREDDKENTTLHDFIDSPPTNSVVAANKISLHNYDCSSHQNPSSGDDQNNSKRSKKKKHHRKHKVSSRSPYDSGNDIDDSDHENNDHNDDISLSPNNDKLISTSSSQCFVPKFSSDSSAPLSVPIKHHLSDSQNEMKNGSLPSINVLGSSPNNPNIISSKKRILRYDKHVKSKSYLIREITYMLKQNASITKNHRKKYDRAFVVFLTRNQFQEIIRIALNVFGYNRANRIRDFTIACSIQERKRPLIILFGGTSGTGKSTLASLIASRLGITKVLSTDNIRHMLRAFISKDEEPVLFASTYHAGEALLTTEEGKALKDKVTPEELTVEGFRRQCKLVIEQLEKIIEQSIERNEGLVVEGVHLLTDFIVDLMKKHPTCILPYIIYISNQQKHKERFAIRAKYMTLEPRNNKYVKYFQNIRQIQKYLYDRAEVYNVPKIDNTNIDRSIAAIHGSVFKSMKMVFEGKKLFNFETGKCSSVHPKALFDKKHQHWSSKRMLQALQKKRESLEIKSFSESASLTAPSSSNNDFGAEATSKVPSSLQTTTATTTIESVKLSSNVSISASTNDLQQTTQEPLTSSVDDVIVSAMQLNEVREKQSKAQTSVLKETASSSSSSDEAEGVDDKASISSRSRRNKKNSVIKKHAVTFNNVVANSESSLVSDMSEKAETEAVSTTSTVQAQTLSQQTSDSKDESLSHMKVISALKKKKKKLMLEDDNSPLAHRPESPEDHCSTPQHTDTESRKYNYYTTSEGVCSLSERDQDSEIGPWIEMDTS